MLLARKTSLPFACLALPGRVRARVAALAVLMGSAFLSLAIGCLPTVPRPAPRTEGDREPVPTAAASATVAPTSASSAAPIAGPGPSPEIPFRLAWMVPSPAWTKAVAIAPWGDVVSYGSRTLRVHAADSGKQSAETSICFTFPNAFGFVADGTGALVCEDSIQVFKFPGAKYRGVRKLKGQARAAAFGAAQVAVGFADGPVRLYSTKDWQELREIPVTGKVSTLALSRDDRLLGVGFEDGRVLWRDLAVGTERPLPAKGSYPLSALVFSPDGRKLFAAAGPIVAVWGAEGDAPLRSFSVVRDIKAARWLTDVQIVTTGADGLLVLDLGDGGARTIGDGSDAASRPPVALDLSLDAKLLCTGAPEGSLRCFARGAMPAVEPLPPERGPTDDCTTAQGEPMTMGGRIAGHTGVHVMVKADANAPLPVAGGCATLLRHVQGAEGELATTSWVEVGAVRIDEVHKDVVRATLVSPEAAALASGVKDKPLDYDTPVRLLWSAR